MATVPFFRLRHDNGTEKSATWIAAYNVAATISSNTTFRIRFTIDNLFGPAYGFTPQLQYNINGGSWSPVPTVPSITEGDTGFVFSSLPVQAVISSHVEDETSTTQQLNTLPDAEYVQSFQPGIFSTTGITTPIVLFNNQYTEVEFCVLIYDDTPGDIINFQLIGTLLNNSITATVNIP